MGNAKSKKRPTIRVKIPKQSPITPAMISLKQTSRSSVEFLQRSESNNVRSATKSHYASFSRTLIKNQDTKKKPNALNISHRIPATLYIFWKTHVETLSTEKRLEIAVFTYLIMMQKCKSNFKCLFQQKTIEEISLRLMAMKTWLLHSLIKNDNLDLKALGKLHRQFGVKLHFFEAYLSALDETLSEYFPNKYKIEIKYCLGRVFMSFIHGMVGKPHSLNSSKSTSDESSDELSGPSASRFSGISGLYEWNKSRSLKDSSKWLQNLTSCLKSKIGRDYFFGFLRQSVCDEIVIFFKLYLQFEESKIEEERFMLLRQVSKICIDINEISPFPINISYETKQDFIRRMRLLEDEWKRHHGHSRCDSMYEPVSPLLFDDVPTKPRLVLPMHVSSNSFSASNSISKNFKVPTDILELLFMEMKRLIMQNHWRKFSSQIVAKFSSQIIMNVPST